jgi:hypothetical protein
MEQWPDTGRRREAANSGRAAESGPRRDGAPTPGLRHERTAAAPSATPTSGRHRASSRGDVRHALSSRRAVRRAVLLHEILGTPKPSEQPGSRDSRLPDVPPTFISRRHRDVAGRGNGHAARVTDVLSFVADTAVGARAPTARPDAVRQPASESLPVIRSVYRAFGASVLAVGRRLGRLPFGSAPRH